MLQDKVFKNIQDASKKILIVTKYWDTEKTHNIIQESQKKYPDVTYGYGENRIETIKEKDFPREKIHFIGNLQSQKIGEIVKCCFIIHSLASIKHAKKIENQGITTKAFVQINLDPEKSIGIPESELGSFLEVCKDFQNLKIIGISGMGRGDVCESDKRKEFQSLISLRDTYIPNGVISAGTSRDYCIALEEGIDIVRVGSSAVKKEA